MPLILSYAPFKSINIAFIPNGASSSFLSSSESSLQSENEPIISETNTEIASTVERALINPNDIYR